jgi:hypothetical protein
VRNERANNQFSLAAETCKRGVSITACVWRVSKHKPTSTPERKSFEWPKSSDVLGTANSGNPAESGLCTLCRADCKGKCEIWLSGMVGRKLLYPRDFGAVTAGSSNTTHSGVNHDALRIQGYQLRIAIALSCSASVR